MRCRQTKKQIRSPAIRQLPSANGVAFVRLTAAGIHAAANTHPAQLVTSITIPIRTSQLVPREPTAAGIQLRPTVERRLAVGYKRSAMPLLTFTTAPRHSSAQRVIVPA